MVDETKKLKMEALRLAGDAEEDPDSPPHIAAGRKAWVAGASRFRNLMIFGTSKSERRYFDIEQIADDLEVLEQVARKKKPYKRARLMIIEPMNIYASYFMIGKDPTSAYYAENVKFMS